MKSKKGFTLVELLGVIILMGLISAAIATPILAQINKTSSKVDKVALDLLYSDTELYMTKYSTTYKKIDGNIYYVTVEQLIQSGLLEEKFLTSYSEETLSKKTQIKVTVNDNSFSYEIPSSQLDTIGSVYNKLTASSTYSYAGGTYIKGVHTNNYVLYNGFMWRLMGINQDGTIRLLMDGNATTLGYNYETSYRDSDAREWLNDYFISRLQYNDIIAKEKWYYAATTSTSTTVDESIYVEDKVGLLSVQEVLLSLSSSKNYFNGKANNYLLNTNSSQSGKVNYMTSSTAVSNINKNAVISLSPVINVYASTIVSDGSGTSADPYVLATYKTSGVGKTIYSNNTMVGEYISYNGMSFRVAEINSEEVKLIYNGTVQTSSTYATSSSPFNLHNGVGNVLNTTIYNSFSDVDKLLTKNIFVGSFYTGANYKSTIFKKQNMVYDVKLGIPALGELLTTTIYNGSSTCSYWLLNMASSTTAYALSSTGAASANTSTTTMSCIRPVIYISSDNIIASGTGTASSPYKLR